MDLIKLLRIFNEIVSLQQGFSMSVLLTFWEDNSLLWGSPVHCMTFSSTLRLFSRCQWYKKSPDTAKWALEVKSSQLRTIALKPLNSKVRYNFL